MILHLLVWLLFGLTHGTVMVAVHCRKHRGGKINSALGSEPNHFQRFTAAMQSHDEQCKAMQMPSVCTMAMHAYQTYLSTWMRTCHSGKMAHRKRNINLVFIHMWRFYSRKCTWNIIWTVTFKRWTCNYKLYFKISHHSLLILRISAPKNFQI